MKDLKTLRDIVRELSPPGYTTWLNQDPCSDGLRLKVIWGNREVEETIPGMALMVVGWRPAVTYLENTLEDMRNRLQDAELAAAMDQKVSEARHRESQRMLRAMNATVEEKCKAIAMLQDQQAQPVFATEYEGEWVEPNPFLAHCPRCEGEYSGDSCHECGYPGLKAIAGTCRHAELYQIKHGEHAGQLGCLEPNCKARFKDDEPLKGMGKIIRGPDKMTKIEEIKMVIDGRFYVHAESCGVFSVEPLNDAAKPPPEGYGFRL